MDKFFALDEKTKSQYAKKDIKILNGWDALECERSVSGSINIYFYYVYDTITKKKHKYSLDR